MRSALLFLAGAAAGAVAVLLAGAGPRGGRVTDAGPRARAPEPGALTAREAEALRERVRAAEERAREAWRRAPAPAEEAAALAAGEDAAAVEGPRPGTRLPDGRIVGGARWPDMTVQMAIGFLETYLAQFAQAANLSDAQEETLRKELEKRVREAMELTASATNGDVTADEVYGTFDRLYDEGRESMRRTLSAEQLAVYEKFENNTRDVIRENVVASEMTTMREEMGLTPEQAARIEPILRQRYERVQKGVRGTIPNVFFRPLRRESDRAIYDETAAQMRAFLDPAQVEALARYEERAYGVEAEYRPMLVPRQPEASSR